MRVAELSWANVTGRERCWRHSRENPVDQVTDLMWHLKLRKLKLLGVLSSKVGKAVVPLWIMDKLVSWFWSGCSQTLLCSHLLYLVSHGTPFPRLSCPVFCRDSDSGKSLTEGCREGGGRTRGKHELLPAFSASRITSGSCISSLLARQSVLDSRPPHLALSVILVPSGSLRF